MDEYEYVNTGDYRYVFSGENKTEQPALASQSKNLEENLYEPLRLEDNQEECPKTRELRWKRVSIVMTCIAVSLMVGVFILIAMYTSINGEQDINGQSSFEPEEAAEHDIMSPVSFPGDESSTVQSTSISIIPTTNISSTQTIIGAEENLALHKQAWQSSTYVSPQRAKTNIATYATDGVTVSKDGYWCTHTLSNKNAWWIVDLIQTYAITEVEIFKRTVGAPSTVTRLRRFFVGVYTDDPPVNPQPGDYPVCSYHPGIVNEAKVTITCNQPMIGRYVIIQFNNYQNYLELCEVVVRGL